MKRLTCEMCGGTDLVKDDGVFVCQSCGCKYSVEEAKRMMVEGTVDIQGTVKVDNSAFVQKYLENARRAKAKEDWEETEKYYNLVEQNDPKNIEAIFYSAYGKAKTTLVDADIYKRQAAFKVLTNCISIIDDNYQIDQGEQNEVVINDMADDLSKMICSGFVYTQKGNGSDNKSDTYYLFCDLLRAFRETIDNIEKVDDQPFLHEASIRLYQTARKIITGFWFTSFNNLLQNWIDEETEELKKLAYDTYWSEHADERDALTSERQELQKQMSDIVKQIDSFPETAALAEVSNQIEEKNIEKKALGLFKGKEKQAVQDQIDALTEKWEEAKSAFDTVVSPYRDLLTKLKDRVAEIEEEFTKER